MAGIASTKPPIIYNGQKTMIWSDNRYYRKRKENPFLPLKTGVLNNSLAGSFLITILDLKRVRLGKIDRYKVFYEH